MGDAHFPQQNTQDSKSFKKWQSPRQHTDSISILALVVRRSATYITPFSYPLYKQSTAKKQVGTDKKTTHHTTFEGRCRPLDTPPVKRWLLLPKQPRRLADITGASRMGADARHNPTRTS